MFSSFWKVMPILTLGLGVGVEAQNVAAQKGTKTQSTYHNSAGAPCGLHEGDCSCLARSCCCAMGGALEVDFLYWRAENPGFTDFAYSQKNTTFVNSYQYNGGSLVGFSSNWDPGFRVGAGWNSDYDRWDLFLDWTWYKNHNTESRSVASTDPHVGLYPISSTVSSTIGPFTTAHASWRLLHNSLDLELGRAYYLTKSITLRPHWGVKAAWLNQKFSGRFATPTALSGAATYSSTGKNNFVGGGPRLGFHSNWHIANSDWSILGKASGSLLLGDTHARLSSDYLTTAGIPYAPSRNFKHHISQLVPNLQVFLGINWGSCLDCNKYFLSINAGWEANVYWNQYNLPMANPYSGDSTTLPTHSSEAVTMEGLTLNVHLDY